MGRRRTKRGYSSRAHKDHPGVSIQIRDGVAVLRWIDPQELTASGKDKQKQEVVHRDNGMPVTCREGAKPFAIQKSAEIHEIAAGLRARHANKGIRYSWELLLTKHAEHLVAAGARPKTLVSYRSCIRFMNLKG